MPGEGATVVHLRILVPEDLTGAALDTVLSAPGSCNVVRLPGAAVAPPGDVLLADVAREGASGLVEDLRAIWAWSSAARSAWSTPDGHLSAASARPPSAPPARPATRWCGRRWRPSTSEAVALNWSFRPLHGDRGPDRRRRHLPRLARS